MNMENNSIHLNIRHIILMLYWIRWGIRNILKEKYGKIAKQTDDLMGVILPSGRYIPYGVKYNRAYFAGRIL
jgi:hypothetical protein